MQATMTPLYPLRFEPIFRRYLWGGRKLGDVLHKPIGPEGDYAESWEICDRDSDQSIVAAGPLRGATLHYLVAAHGKALLGMHHSQKSFPLLLKFLDCQRRLSVQVHPSDEQAALLTPPDRGKTEAWVVLAAEPGSVIFAGLKRGFDRAALEREVARGTCELTLHQVHPAPGDCLLLPAGTVHALGEGLLVAEIQQSSDTTYRLFDWNRLGADGRPRALHVRQALDTIDYSAGPVQPQPPRATERPQVVELAACEKFVLRRWQLDNDDTIGGDDRCHLLAVIAGAVTVAGDVEGRPLELGETMLLPAESGPVALRPQPGATLLSVHLP